MKKSVLLFLCLTSSCVVFATAANGVLAQSYPSKPIRIIAPFQPGGPADIRARLIAEKLTESLGQQVVVENKPGADGALGMETGAKSAPDGYTIIMGSYASLAVNPSLYKNLRYDPIKDYEPITQLTSSAIFLLVNPSLPVKSVKELISLAKSKPGQLNYGTASSAFYLIVERFKLRAGIDMVRIPYKGAAPAMTALISGEVPVLVEIALSVVPHIKAGKIRAIAVGSAKRSPALPDVPTISESGLPGFEISTWQGMLAPARTPKDIVKKLNSEIVRIMHMPAVKHLLENVGGDQIVVGTPEQFADFIKSEFENCAKVVKDAGIPRIE